MAIAQHELKQTPVVLTYEDYLNEGETPGRYEIINGVREYITSPAPEHQLIQVNLCRILKNYEDESGSGLAFVAPCDMLVSQATLQVRQPDLFYISFDRWGDKDMSDPSPLNIAPELVVEILSPSESRRQIERKISEYGQAGVLECWLISPEAATVEVLKLTPSSSERAGIYAPGQDYESLTFAGLSIDVSRVFRLPRRGMLHRIETQTGSE